MRGAYQDFIDGKLVTKEGNMVSFFVEMFSSGADDWLSPTLLEVVLHDFSLADLKAHVCVSKQTSVCKFVETKKIIYMYECFSS